MSDAPKNGSRMRGNALRALEFVRPQLWPVAAVAAMALGVAALGALEPLAMKYFFDMLGSGTKGTLATGIIMLVAIGLLKEAIGGWSNWLTWKVRLAVNTALLEATVTRLHYLPMEYHRKETVGSIMTKLDRGINGLVGAVSEIAFSVFPGIVYLVISVFIMVRLEWRLSLIVLFFAPLPPLIGMWAAGEQTERERKLMERWARIFSRLNEALSGILTVKCFGAEEYEKKRFMHGVVKTNELVLKGIGLDTGVGAVKNTVALTARIMALMAGGYLAMRGEITAGTLVAFLGYSGGIFAPVQGLTGVYQTSRKAAVSLETVFSILDAGDAIPESVGEASRMKGAVRFSGVSFSYKRGVNVLKGIDLTVAPGEVVAFVGPSGAGKTTLMALLQRLYDPKEGAIFIDGVNLKEVEPVSLRRRIGSVSQEAVLFNDTIRNNIAYGRPEATEADVIAAAKAANAHSFITRLPLGYDTVTGERGSLLSAGERQRIAIARALVMDPPILVLDEATSSLDAESEYLVQGALSRLMKGRTTFIIAHRLSTVVKADRIIVLKAGKITEAGSHSELMKKDGYYAFLVKRQTNGLLDVGEEDSRELA